MAGFHKLCSAEGERVSRVDGRESDLADKISAKLPRVQHSNRSNHPVQDVQMFALGASSPWAAPLRSLLTGSGFFFIGSLSDVWLRTHVASWWVAMMDDALVGLGAGLLVLLYERRQRQGLIRKLEVIRMMNHHVRNSLQVIFSASTVAQQEELTTHIQAAVGRIEWALREVLPGQTEELSNLSFYPASDIPPPQYPTTVP